MHDLFDHFTDIILYRYQMIDRDKYFNMYIHLPERVKTNKSG